MQVESLQIEAYFCFMSPRRFFFVMAFFGCLAAYSQDASRFAPSLIHQKTNRYRVVVDGLKDFETWIKKNYPTSKIEIHSSKKFITVENVPLRELQSNAQVKFVDVTERKPHEERSVEDLDLSVNTINAVHSHFPFINGDELNASVKEKPFDKTDIDFKGRVLTSADFDEAITTHATTMATLMAGGGNSSPKSKGAAWGASLTTSDFENLMPDENAMLIAVGITVQNHSYGVGIENYYGIETQAYDDACQSYPEMLHVFSAGNAGDQASESGPYGGITGFANLTGQFKMSKSTLSVGSIDKQGNIPLLSSKGPAYDGRVKPELVAFGDAGSSESAAYVSGISMLIQHAFKNETGSVPPSSLVIATLINSANDVGRAAVDFESGFGNADALGAIQTISENQYRINQLIQNETIVYTVSVPACHEFKVSLAWTDVEASINAPTALVNDLDLKVIQVSTGDEFLPWVLNSFPNVDSLTQDAKRKEDHLNTIEQVTIQFPSAGDYQIQVNGFGVQSTAQQFSIAYEFNQDFSWTYPAKNDKLMAGEEYLLRWENFTTETNGTLEYKLAGESTWTLISNAVPLDQNFYSWIAPDTLRFAQVRMSANGWTVESDSFTLSPVAELKVAYVCEAEAMVYWSPTGNNQYQVFLLGEKYMEPVALVSDSLFTFNPTEQTSSFFAIAPVNNVNGEKSVTINYTQQGVGCYFTSFLPTQLVSDSVIFNASLSTNYNAETLQLQRWDGTGFMVVYSQPINNNFEFTLSDFNAPFGRNIYRAAVITSDQKMRLSQEEEIFFVQPSEIVVFPNPALTGDIISIAIEEDQPVSIELIDNLGKPVFETSDFAELVSFQAPLLRGAYILRVISSTHTRTSRLIIL
ncbi:MAG: S8 family peptidase [Flammeovirgaceae bacterium]|nr:S8 family peptidase [Flammeovirgaceae bacterium]